MSTAKEAVGPMSLADVAKVSELKELGWDVDGEGKVWTAQEVAGDKRTVGPASSIKALHTQVMMAAGPVKSKESKPDFELTREPEREPKSVKAKNSQPILPNTQDAVLEDMRTAILEYRETTMQILELQAEQKEQKKLVMGLMHKFEDELSVDPDTGNKFFQAEMVIAELAVEMKEDLKTRTANA